MDHFWDAHTWDYFDVFLNRPNATGLWPIGTTINDIKRYLAEALSKLKSQGGLPEPNSPLIITLSNGITNNNEIKMKNDDYLVNYLKSAIGIILKNKSDLDSQLSQESRIADVIQQKISWRYLSNEEKQMKRLGLLKLAQKYQDTEAHQKSYQYMDAFYKVYDLLLHLLNVIDNEQLKNRDDISLIRLKTAILIEKELMDEHSHPEKSGHYPEKTMLNLLSDSEVINLAPEKIIELQKYITEMYKNWAKNPEGTSE